MFSPVIVTYTDHDAPRALYADFVTRSLAANDENKMAALGGIAGSERTHDHIIF